MTMPSHEIEVKPRIRLLWAAEAVRVESVPQLVQELLPAGCLGLVYGDANTGKSTLALDLGLAIATGTSWRGHRVQRGVVLHVAGEGLYGLRMRLRAAIHEGHGSPGMHYALVDGALDLTMLGDQGDLLATIQSAEIEAGEKVALVIIDTLARCFGIDENDGAQMRAAIAACDQLREQTGAAVLLVHHAGKDASKGARGHSSLRAAVDVELLVEGRVNPRTLTVTKQRDLPTLDPMVFTLEPVCLGRDLEVGDDLSACIVQHSNTPPLPPKPSGKQQSALLAELERRYSSGEVAWTDRDLRTIGREIGMHKNTARSAALGLHSAGYLVPSVGGTTLTNPPEVLP